MESGSRERQRRAAAVGFIKFLSQPKKHLSRRLSKPTGGENKNTGIPFTHRIRVKNWCLSSDSSVTLAYAQVT